MNTMRNMRGGDRGGIRSYNRRAILNLIRRSGALPKAEIARLTGLSAQAASVIVNQLLKDKLVRKEGKVRGQVGQPYTPIALDPDGAFAIGVKIGRRSLEILLIDFVGDAVEHRVDGYERPRAEHVVGLLLGSLSELLDGLDPARRSRVAGVGIAIPWMIQGWAEAIGLSAEEAAAWNVIDPRAVVEEATGLPVEVINDATAACAAEVQFGEALSESSALYIYIGTFVGGGVVLDGRLYEGVRGNAGAIGSMPIALPAGDGADGVAESGQLIDFASLFFLDHALHERRPDGHRSFAEAVLAPEARETVAAWRDRAAKSLARAIASASSVIDFECVVIDAMLPPERVDEIVDAVRAAQAEVDWTGLSPVEIRSGSIGARARVLGAAILPLIRTFSPDQDLLVKPGLPVAERQQS